MKETKNVPQLRFSGFDDEWEEKKLGEVSDRITRKNENLESTLPLTISAQYGLVDQITFFNNQVASTTNLRNYFLVKNGEFAYNKSYSAGYPWGAIKRLDRYEKGVLSTLYIVFKPKNINSDYLLSYYDTDKWYKQVSEIAAEGARNHGLLNIAPIDFFQTTFVAPKSELEQQKIGSLLSNLDSLIQAKTKKLESLKAVKKSLLQKCFPKAGEKVPEIRFAGFSGDWEEKKLGEVCEINPSSNLPSVFEYVDLESVLGSEMISHRTEFKNNAPSRAQRLAKKGDVFYQTVRPYQKNNYLFELDFTNYVFSTGYAQLRSKEINSKFLMCQIQSDTFVNMVLEKCTGTSYPAINSTELSGISLLVSNDFIEQQKIGQFFSKYDSLISVQQKEIDKLKYIKKSLLQKMFV